MTTKIDAHAHFFREPTTGRGYARRLPDNCRQVDPDELTLYRAYAQQHDITQVLAVGYEGEAWAQGNNAYLAQLVQSHAFVRPLAYVHHPAQLTVDHLEERQAQGFVGLSLYLFSAERTGELAHVPDAVWAWLARRNWLISLNSRGEHLAAWQPVLHQHPDLALLLSHLGLPPAQATAPTLDQARDLLAPVCALAEHAGYRVKLSGFYALTDPQHAYPHSPAWPYAQVLLDVLGADRLLWGSDFIPALEVVSFPQTVDVIDHLPGLSGAEKEAIWGDNLQRLLQRAGATP